MNELALFAGAGGGILGGHLLGWRCVCAVEIDNYARRVLLARQRDGMLPHFPIWDDVTTFEGHPWRGRVDVISGGFPCQDISAAGKGAGITGARSGLWSHMARIIGEVRPRYCFVENSPLLVYRGLDVVLSDLAALGYSARWGIVGAHHAGAPHKRDRIWIRCELGESMRADGERGARGIFGAQAAKCGTRQLDGYQPHGSEHAGEGCAKGHVADANCIRESQSEGYVEEQRGRIIDGGEAMADTSGAGCEGRKQPTTLRNNRGGAQTHGPVSECSCSPRSEVSDTDQQYGDNWRFGAGEIQQAEPPGICGGEWWESEPHLGGMAHGLAAGLDIHGSAAAGYVGRVATGVPNRVGRLKAIGNGQVPAVAALAWRVLS